MQSEHVASQKFWQLGHWSQADLVAHVTPMVRALLKRKATVSHTRLPAMSSDTTIVSSHQPKFRMAMKPAYEPYDNLPGAPAAAFAEGKLQGKHASGRAYAS